MSVELSARPVIDGLQLDNIVQAGGQPSDPPQMSLFIHKGQHEIIQERAKVVSVLDIAITFLTAIPDALGLKDKEEGLLELRDYQLLVLFRNR